MPSFLDEGQVRAPAPSSMGLQPVGFSTDCSSKCLIEALMGKRSEGTNILSSVMTPLQHSKARVCENIRLYFCDVDLQTLLSCFQPSKLTESNRMSHNFLACIMRSLQN